VGSPISTGFPPAPRRAQLANGEDFAIAVAVASNSTIAHDSTALAVS